MLKNRPAVLFCLLFIVGIIVGWQWDFSLWYIFAFMLLFLVLAGFFFMHWDVAHHTLSLLFLPVILLTGIFKITLDKNSPPKDEFDPLFRFPHPVTIRGMIADPPRRQGARFQCIVEGHTIADQHGQRPVEGSILVTFTGEGFHPFLDSLDYGSMVEFSATLMQPGTARNPGEFDLRNYLLLQGIHARCFVDEPADILVLGKSGNWLMSEVIYPLRKSISRYLDSLIGGEEAKFLRGLVIGERSEISPEVKTSFINSGVMHILAVSGLHVGLISLILIGILAGLRMSEKLRVAMLCLFLFLYIFLTGSSPSVARAVVMAIVVIGARFFERKSDVINSLAVAATVLLMLDARQLFMPGFQLSFAAVLSIVLLYPKLYSLTEKFPPRLRGNSVVTNILKMSSISIAAGLGTLPFTSLYFGKIPIIGFLANLLIVPLSGIVLALGITTVTFSFVWIPLASLYAEGTRLSAAILLDSVQFFGNLSFSYVDADFSFWNIITFYAVLAGVMNLSWFTVKRCIISALVALNLFLYLWLFGFVGGPGQIRMSFLDVGQGDAVFIEFPDQTNMLIDAGPRAFTIDAGKRFVISFLKSRGITHIDAVIVSHPHNDHLGGVPSVLRELSVGRIVDGGSDSPSALFSEYVRLIDSLRIPRQTVRTGESLEGFTNLRLYFLHPDSSFLTSFPGENLNNQSLVFRLVYGSTSALFVGDAEEEAEQRMLRQYDGFLRSDVLKVGHHGSSTSSSHEFLRRVRPTWAVVSVGRNNPFDHPSAEVLQRFDQGKVHTHRTDENNAIVLVSDGKRWKEEDWR